MALPQWVLDLRTRRDNITQELKNIDNTGSRQKPGAAPDMDGEAGGVQDTAYRLSLLTELSAINAALRDAKSVIAAEEATEDTDPYTIEVVMDS